MPSYNCALVFIFTVAALIRTNSLTERSGFLSHGRTLRSCQCFSYLEAIDMKKVLCQPFFSARITGTYAPAEIQSHSMLISLPMMNQCRYNILQRIFHFSVALVPYYERFIHIFGLTNELDLQNIVCRSLPLLVIVASSQIVHP